MIRATLDVNVLVPGFPARIGTLAALKACFPDLKYEGETAVENAENIVYGMNEMKSDREIANREPVVSETATKPPPPKEEPVPLPLSPQEFYATVTKRPDIREILKRLADI